MYYFDYLYKNKISFKYYIQLEKKKIVNIVNEKPSLSLHEELEIYKYKGNIFIVQ